MKDCIEISGFNDVVIYSTWFAHLIKDENGKIITKNGDVVEHTKRPESVSFYQNKYDYDGRFSGVELIVIPTDKILLLADKINSLKNETSILATYENDDLPF